MPGACTHEKRPPRIGASAFSGALPYVYTPLETSRVARRLGRTDYAKVLRGLRTRVRRRVFHDPPRARVHNPSTGCPSYGQWVGNRRERVGNIGNGLSPVNRGSYNDKEGNERVD
jgi:hypothetical protein